MIQAKFFGCEPEDPSPNPVILLDNGVLNLKGEQMSSPATNPTRLKRSLTLWDLILYGVIVIQPVAPMSVFGVLSDRGFANRWKETGRCYLLAYGSELPRLKGLVDPSSLYIVRENAGNYLLTNHPLRSHQQ